jgi:hypothetical protein
LAGLDYEYNSLVSSIAARVKPITFGELYSQLLAFETRLQLQGVAGQTLSSANSATRGRGGHGPRGGFTPRGEGMVTSHTSQRTGFLHINYAKEPTTRCSSATRDLI